MEQLISHMYVHCSDTPADMDIGVNEIRHWHVSGNGWSDIGYAWVIRRDGTIEKGRDLDGDGEVDDEVGAHVFGHNRNSVGVCLVGGANGDFNFTFAQIRSLISLTDYYTARWPNIKIKGHRDVSGVNKSCPNFDVRSLIYGRYN